jgi:hypothetical protein
VLITVDATTIRKAKQRIQSCEHCHPDDAEIPFVLAEIPSVPT